MKKENRKILWSLIQKKGSKLVGRLPEDYRHPKGRNPYAHICTLIKDKFGRSYKDINDDFFPKVESFIKKILPND
tara:strand:+ start:836 stop:1060 length:225 start_codon:yes stop_codon:yes gene_type:complete